MTKSSLNVFICTGLCKHGCKVACRHTSWQGKVMPKWNLFPLQILFYFHNTFMRSKAMLASFLSPNTSHQTCAEGLPTQSNCESSAPWSPLSCTSWLICFQSYMLGFLEKKKSMPYLQSSIMENFLQVIFQWLYIPEICLPNGFELKQWTLKNHRII